MIEWRYHGQLSGTGKDISNQFENASAHGCEFGALKVEFSGGRHESHPCDIRILFTKISKDLVSPVQLNCREIIGGLDTRYAYVITLSSSRISLTLIELTVAGHARMAGNGIRGVETTGNSKRRLTC